MMPEFLFQDDDVVQIGYKKINCHIIFDVKMCLSRKARFVAGVHQTDPKKESTYSRVVLCDSVCISLTLNTLNNLNILSSDVHNSYLNAPTKEKMYKIASQ